MAEAGMVARTFSSLSEEPASARDAIQ